MRRFATVRALPTLLRVGFVEAIAYRAEMLVWVFSTTMPLIMLMVWTAVAEASPVQGTAVTWSSPRLVAYFLTVFIVRQMTSSWAAWEMNWEVRQGTLSMRLLRPLHPIISYMMTNIAYFPMRFAVTAPVVLVILASKARHFITTDPVLWLLFAGSLVGAWLITFFANAAIGTLSLYFDSSIRAMEVWLVLFFVMSGYLFPLDLFPGWLRALTQWLPFRYQIGLPVEIVTGALPASEALALLGRQWLWALILVGGTLLLWRRGVRRFQAYGG